MKKIIVTVTNDLSTDQRVHKVCTTLHNNGFKILLIGRKFSNSLPLSRDYKTKRISLLFNKGFLFYAEYNLRLFGVLFFKKKDILLSNDLDTLLPNYLLHKIQQTKLVYDSHELFPEIPELINKPSVKKFWNTIEKLILPKIKNNYTVCKSIANYYQDKYNSNFKTILNLPTKKVIEKSEFPFDKKQQKVILYQGAVNIGRGLELMIDTIPYLKNCILVIIGDGDVFLDLKKLVAIKKLEEKVYFLGKIPSQKLHHFTTLADLGISIEEDLGLNYKFALPNKIFDYIQAEIPILVSDLPEMKRIAIDYNVGEVVKSRKPKDLANQIEKLLNKDFSTQLKNAKEELIWEKQEEKLLQIFKN
ncbi:glycosyltransferase [Polaribacter sargassicola]|uniref:glycosyltransferase n=1 Tax=Polaribacter sargassicola TaxID=2836891 RepID=UPI001F3791CE|nr:glycosyltransferase [Polaribacter sp. DS7-9]MCG1035824.1 glycosyltransferase [Polaribacter sp. DS7-9]